MRLCERPEKNVVMSLVRGLLIANFAELQAYETKRDGFHNF